MASSTSTTTTMKNSKNSTFNNDFHHRRQMKRNPAIKPPFSVGDVRRAIPAHCFEHSLITSYAYLLMDITFAVTLLYAAMHIDTVLADKNLGAFANIGTALRHVAWLVYWSAQGVVFTGLWVIGHECGHGAFSANATVNNITGWTVHSLLMVPYFAWQISHKRHHSNTGNIDRDEVFVPNVARGEFAHNAIYEDDGIPDEGDNYAMSYAMQLMAVAKRLFWITFMTTTGWPGYLWANLTSNKNYPKGRWVNHFWPYSPLFASAPGRPESIRNPMLVLISDIGLVMSCTLLAYLAFKTSVLFVIYMYGVPLLVNVFFLVTITFLQHTHKVLPHYDNSEWDWLRGALATVDRDFGILNFFHHHISDTHVVHHLFHTMPFYHAQEATKAVKKVLGNYYVRDDTHWVKALWQTYGSCDEVRADRNHRGVYWY